MGRPKESLPFGDTTLLGQVAGTLVAAVDDVVVVARGADQPLPPLPPGVAVATDAEPDRGPLHGLHAGLRHLQAQGYAPTDVAFASACDAPFVAPGLPAWLAARLGGELAVAPLVDGRPQPLCAVYRLAVLPHLDELLARGTTRLQDLLRHVATRLLAAAELRAIDPELRSVENLNTPADYERARHAPPARPPL